MVFGAAACAVAAPVLAATNGNRMGRIFSWPGMGSTEDSQGLGCQALTGEYALASGGWFGVGIGQSRQEWNWIPEAHNDFIFTILGEELGLVGTLLVLALFAILAIAVFKTIARTQDTFARIVSCGIITWIIGQAIVNIAVVRGLLPVIGVPLPFISYGGSAMVSLLAGIGMILAVTRTRQIPTRTVRRETRDSPPETCPNKIKGRSARESRGWPTPGWWSGRSGRLPSVRPHRLGWGRAVPA